MTRVVGVRFRTAGKIYFFDPEKFDVKKGDNVIVETARGIEFGTVVGNIREVEDDKVVAPLKPILRIASERDRQQEAENKIKEKEAFEICLEKIKKHGLEMKLIDAEYTFDNNKVLFYFTADGRIDFRELVKDLAGVFKTRIELRQIGVRDETKTMGGIGICGRELCCHSYLSDFIPVSIKMAKEQSLSLNPAKISGVCGRLMCCLKYEEDTYEELNRKLPGVGDFCYMEDGLKGEVQSVNVLRQRIRVVVDVSDEKEVREYEVGQIKFHKRRSKNKQGSALEDLTPEEKKELELLEKKSKEEKEEDMPAPKEKSKQKELSFDRARQTDRTERSRWPEGRREDAEQAPPGQERADRQEERSARHSAGRPGTYQSHPEKKQERGSRPQREERSERSERDSSERKTRSRNGERISRTQEQGSGERHFRTQEQGSGERHSRTQEQGSNRKYDRYDKNREHGQNRKQSGSASQPGQLGAEKGLRTEPAKRRGDAAGSRHTAARKADTVERRADMAERRTDAAERRADMAERRTDMTERKTDAAVKQADTAE